MNMQTLYVQPRTLELLAAQKPPGLTLEEFAAQTLARGLDAMASNTKAPTMSISTFDRNRTLPRKPGAWTGNGASNQWAKKLCCLCAKPFNKAKRPKAEAVTWQNQGVTMARFVCRPCLLKLDSKTAGSSGGGADTGSSDPDQALVSAQKSGG
jgi:hypothetical protein